MTVLETGFVLLEGEIDLPATFPGSDHHGPRRPRQDKPAGCHLRHNRAGQRDARDCLEQNVGRWCAVVTYWEDSELVFCHLFSEEIMEVFLACDTEVMEIDLGKVGPVGMAISPVYQCTRDQTLIMGSAVVRGEHGYFLRWRYYC